MYHTFRICQALVVAAAMLAALAPAAVLAQAQAPTDADLGPLEEGMRLYQGLNSCELRYSPFVRQFLR